VCAEHKTQLAPLDERHCERAQRQGRQQQRHRQPAWPTYGERGGDHRDQRRGQRADGPGQQQGEPGERRRDRRVFCLISEHKTDTLGIPRSPPELKSEQSRMASPG